VAPPSTHHLVALAPHAEGLEAALAAVEDDSSRASIRRIARALASAAQSADAPHIAASARLLQHTPDHELEAATRALLASIVGPKRGAASEEVRLLLVEDDRTVATMVRAYLEAAGWIVNVAASASEAETLLAAAPIDVVLLDLILPDRDGRDLLLQLREDPETADLPVIVLSGTGGAVARAECLAVGASEFFQKPPDPDLLRSAVSRQLAERRKGSDAPRDHEPEPLSGPARILVVEDDRVTATLIHHRLVREGFEVMDFLNGEDAHNWACESDFDLAILDVKVPGMDGFELLERLRGIPRFASVPIVMLTGLGGESEVVRGLELGANDYMVKPFSPTELLARVRRLIHALDEAEPASVSSETHPCDPSAADAP
jgi:DNA-binding response OmpR family regulator